VNFLCTQGKQAYANIVSQYRLPQLIPSALFQIHYEIIRLYGLCHPWVPEIAVWMTQGRLQRFLSFEWGLMNREWAERKLSCPAANYCSKHLLERPKWRWVSKMLLLELTRFIFGLCSETTKTFRRSEGNIQGRHFSLPEVIICYWKQTLHRY
jgi:hypothetical protein